MSLFCKQQGSQIIIGLNQVPKIIYQEYKDVFDLIIVRNDIAWNTKFSRRELKEFFDRLAFNKIEGEKQLTLLNKECKNGCEKMDINELAKQETIRNGFDNIPVGMTKLVANSIDISPTEVEFNGIKKTRYELTAKTVDGKEVHFSCGVQIYNGLIEASKVKGIKTVYITRNGTTKDDTKYTVVGE